MPSPPLLSEQIAAVNRAALEELAVIWALASVEDVIAVLHELMPGFLDTWSMAAAALAADWYDDLRETDKIPGRFTAIVPELGDKGAHELVGWATASLLGDEPDLTATRALLEGGAQRRIADSARETVMASSVADPKARGWQRVGSGTSCGFCQLLISRGFVYSKANARFGSHDNCNCSVVPAWGGKPVKVKPYTPSEKGITEAEKAATAQWVKQSHGKSETERLRAKNEAAAEKKRASQTKSGQG